MAIGGNGIGLVLTTANYTVAKGQGFLA